MARKSLWVWRLAVAATLAGIPLQMSAQNPWGVADSTETDSLHRIGFNLMLRRRYAEAEDVLRRAVDLNAKRFESWLLLGEAQMGLQRLEDAYETFGIARDKARDQKSIAKASYLRAVTLFRRYPNDLSRARYEAVDAVLNDSTHAEAHTLIGKIHYDSSRKAGDHLDWTGQFVRACEEWGKAQRFGSTEARSLIRKHGCIVPKSETAPADPVVNALSTIESTRQKARIMCGQYLARQMSRMIGQAREPGEFELQWYKSGAHDTCVDGNAYVMLDESVWRYSKERTRFQRAYVLARRAGYLMVDRGR